MDGRGRDEATALAFGRNQCALGDVRQDATRCLLHRTEIGNIENGRRIPRVDTMVRLAGALEVKAEVLLSGIEWLPAPPAPPPVGFVVQFPA